MTDSAELTVPLHLIDAELPAPAYARPGDAGADLRTTVDVRLAPGERALVPTGVALALPLGYAGFIHPRSGLAVRCGLSVVNAPGTIDAGYRGEIQVPLINLDPHEDIVLQRGDRIAQLVVQPVVQVRFQPVAELPDSERGTAGFGSTGGFGPAAGTTTAPASASTAGVRGPSADSLTDSSTDTAAETPGRAS